jgi:hypothetical protein
LKERLHKALIPTCIKKSRQAYRTYTSANTKSAFSYKSEDIVYDIKDKSLQLGATLTIPEGKGPFPAALLITGSGPQNRDEDIWVISHLL